MRLAIAVVCLCLFSGPAGADLADDEKKCGEQEVEVAACTRLIGSGKWQGKDAAWLYFNRGLAHYNTKAYRLALPDFDRAVQLDPQDQDAVYHRGITYAFLREFERARADLDAAIRLKPDDFRPYYDRGVVFGELKAYDKAIADYTEALRLNPDHDRSYNNRAWTYLLMGQPAKGLPDADRALELNKDAAIYHTRGRIYEALGRRAEAIADYREALRLDPANEHARRDLERLGEKL